MRLGQRAPVHEPQPIADRSHPSRRRLAPPSETQLRGRRLRETPPAASSTAGRPVRRSLQVLPSARTPAPTRRRPRAARPRPPAGRSRSWRAARAASRSARRRRRSCCAAPTPARRERRRGTRRAGSLRRGPSVSTTICAPAFSSAVAARSGSSSPVISGASAWLARTSSAPGTHAFALAAASAFERQRCRRRFGSKIDRSSALERQLASPHRDLALVGADERVRADEQRSRSRRSPARRDRPARGRPSRSSRRRSGRSRRRRRRS